MSSNNYYKEKREEAVKLTEARLKFKFKGMDYTPCHHDTGIFAKSDKWYRHFLVKVPILNKLKSFILSIPKEFPYKFPSIYITNADKTEYEHLPHIDNKPFVCTFDPNEAKVNSNKPFDVVCAVIKKAKDIIEDGILKKNIKDYEDEFINYWALESDGYKIISILEPETESQEICIIDLINLTQNYQQKLDFNNIENIKRYNAIAYLKDYKYLVAQDCQTAFSWLQNVGIVISRKEYQADIIKEGLFLPLKTLGTPPFPSNNFKISNFLEKTSRNDYKTLFNFLQKHERPSLIVFSLKSRDNCFLGAWQYSKLMDEVKVGKETKKLNHIKGFRKDKNPLTLELRLNTPIKKFLVERFDKERLFNRGGTGLQMNQDYKINMIGCGSVGSYLAADLVKIGVNNFVLVDDDSLCSENLARHYCSIEYINQPKVQSLKEALCKEQPHLNILTKQTDLRNLIIENVDFLNEANLNIIAIADYTTEMMVNDAYKAGLINIPTLIVWVEPYIKAGQAVLLQPNKRGCLNCLFIIQDNNSIFKYSISKFEQKNLLKDAGCHSTYVPYGAIDVCSFTNFLTRIIDKIYKNEYTENMLFQFIKNQDELSFSLNMKAFSELEDFEYCCEGT